MENFRARTKPPNNREHGAGRENMATTSQQSVVKGAIRGNTTWNSVIVAL